MKIFSSAVIKCPRQIRGFCELPKRMIRGGQFSGESGVHLAKFG
jgi:hypothetical protein